MAEQELQEATEIARKVATIIDAILATGDWENSIFLKASTVKLQKFRVAAERLSHLGQQDESSTDVIDKTTRRRIPPGYSQVFILLYQVDGANLQSWYHIIKTLMDYSVTRPVYKSESYAQECIRAKKDSDIARNGYAVVNIKNENFYGEEQASVDAFDHQVYVLKENSVKLENIVEFVHANKNYYAIYDNKLVALDGIES